MTALGGVARHRLYALFAVGVAVGLREGELLALQCSDVDWNRGLHVRQNVQRLLELASCAVRPKTPVPIELPDADDLVVRRTTTQPVRTIKSQRPRIVIPQFPRAGIAHQMTEICRTSDDGDLSRTSVSVQSLANVLRCVIGDSADPATDVRPKSPSPQFAAPRHGRTTDRAMKVALRLQAREDIHGDTRGQGCARTASRRLPSRRIRAAQRISVRDEAITLVARGGSCDHSPGRRCDRAGADSSGLTDRDPVSAESSVAASSSTGTGQSWTSA